MSETDVAICTGVVDYELDDETVLFVEDRGELFRLNPTAALVWRGLQSGMPSRDIVNVLVQMSGARHDEVERDVESLIAGLQEIGALARRGTAVPESALSSRVEPRIVRHPKRILFHENSRARCYRLLDFRFTLKTPLASLDLETHRLLSRFSVRNDASPGVALEVIQEGHDWVLYCEGELIDRTPTEAGVIPMLHANVLLMAYASSEGMAVLHAAAVSRAGRCVLMPAVSGSGKSTLTAALVSSGFDYYSDDLVMLTREPVRVRAVPTCLGLKSGSWKPLDHLFPVLSQLRVYHRADGKQVKYLSLPQTAVDASTEAHAVVFPTWTSEPGMDFREISSAEALAALTTAGYDLPNRINRDVVECLIRWIAGLPCFELRYHKLEDAVRGISTLLP